MNRRLLGFRVYLFRLLIIATCLAALTVPANAQVIGSNIDVIQYKSQSEIDALHKPGDLNPAIRTDLLNRMLETDVAVDPTRPGRAVAVFNDYRYSLSSGQSWCSWAYTKNGGNTWQNYAIPDLPNKPHHVLNNFCTDPVVTWDVFGNAYMIALGGTKGSDTQVYILRLRTKDDASGDLVPPSVSDIVMVDSGNNVPGADLDKPFVMYSPPTAANPVCNGRGQTSNVANCGAVRAFWAIFDGNAGRTKIMYASSASLSLDRPLGFTRPVKLNGTLRFNNMTAGALSPVDGTLYLAFTSFDNANRGVFIVRSDNGNTWTDPIAVAGGGAPYFPYNQDQDSSTGLLMDRSLVISTLIVHKAQIPGTNQFRDQLLLGFQEYVNTITGAPASPIDATGALIPNVLPRIGFTASFDRANTWSDRRAGEVGAPPDAMQLKPRMASSGGLASVIFEDSRDVYQNGTSDIGGSVKTGGDCLYSRGATGLYYMNGMDCKRNVRVMQADLTNWTSGLPTWGASKRVTQFPTIRNSVMSRGLAGPIPGPPAANCDGSCFAGYEPNVISSKNGTQAFSGDYTGHSADHPLIFEDGIWRFPTKITDPRTFYALWDDNRWQTYPTLGGPKPGLQSKANDWTQYNGVNINNGTRNYKPFFAKVSPGLLMFWTGTDRVLDNGTVEFVVTLQNQTDTDILVRESLSSGDWAFNTPRPGQPVVTFFDTKIDRHSSVTKKVVRLMGSSMSVRVSAVQTGGGIPVGGLTPLYTGLTAEVTFNVSSLPAVQSPGHVLNISDPTIKCLSDSAENCKNKGPAVNTLNKNSQPSGNDAFDSDAFDSDAFDSDAFDSDAFDSSATGDILDKDTTWTITGTGLPTAINTKTVVDNAQELLNSNFGFQLLFYQSYFIPYPNTQAAITKKFVVDVPFSNIRVNKNNASKQISDAFDSDAFDSDAFDSTAPSDQISNAGVFAGNSDTFKATLRDYKPSGTPLFVPDQTASQAAATQNATGALSADFSDASAPVVVGTNSPTPNLAGWNNTNPTVHFAVTDPGSGIKRTELKRDGVTISLINYTSFPPSTNCGPDQIVTTETPFTGTVFTCTATNGDGDTTTTNVTVKLDKTAPETFVDSGPNGATADGTTIATSSAAFTFHGTDALSGVALLQCQVDGNSFTFCTSPTTYTGLADGAHNFSVRAKDVADNTDQTPAIRSFTVDTTPPVVTFGSLTPNGQNGWFTTSPVTVNVTAADALSNVSSFSCTDGAAAIVPVSTSGIGTPTATATLSVAGDGIHNLSCTATDSVGNSGAAPGSSNSRTVKIDTTAPTLTFGDPTPAANAGGWNNTNVSFPYTASDATSGVATPNPASGTLVLTAEGSSVTGDVIVTDVAGNTATFTTNAVKIDKTPPNTTITSNPPPLTNSANAVFSFTGTDNLSTLNTLTFQCSLDGAAFIGCTSPAAYTGLSDGSHNFRVLAIDQATNADPTPASYSWTVDTTPPDTNITNGPANGSTITTNSATFEFSGTDASGIASFECQFDGGAASSCTSPKTYSGLSNASHTFTVRAFDNAGNPDTSPATRSFTVNVTYVGVSALSFDGVNDFVKIPDSASLDLTNFTIEAWVKVDSPDFVRMPFISKGEGAGFGNYTLSVLGNQTLATPGYVEYAQNTASSNFSCCGDTPHLTFGQWTHVAATASGTTVSVYVNGVLVGSFNDAPSRITNNAALLLGRILFASGGEQWLHGLMDEVRIWNVARTGAEIAANYNHQVPATSAGLVAYYKFDETAGDQTIVDSTSSGNNGTLGADNNVASDDPPRVTSDAPILP